MPPLVVVDGLGTAFEAAVSGVETAGWTVIRGFAAGPRGVRRSVCVGPVTNAVDAAGALVAALGGCGLVIAACAPDEVIDPLVDDLRHVGRVDHRREPPATRAPAATGASGGSVLADTERALLRRLAGGESLREAASGLGLARRTADRRLAAARRRLGVARTAEAVAQARRRGLLD